MYLFDREMQKHIVTRALYAKGKHLWSRLVIDSHFCPIDQSGSRDGYNANNHRYT